MTKFLKAIADAALRLFKTDAAKKFFVGLFDKAPAAAPFIAIAADIVTGLTPTVVDDVAWGIIRAKFPRLFDGSILTKEEMGIYALGVATELFMQRFPELSTTDARTAVQNYYMAQKRGGVA